MPSTIFKNLAPLIICILGSFFYVYDYFLAVAPSVMTHDLSQAFSLNAAQLGTLMSAFFLASTFFQIPAGVLLDRFGARKLLSLSVLISGLGTLLFAMATTSWQLACARVLMGIGSPFAFLGAIYLVSRWYSHRYFALASGFIQLGAAIGSIIGGGPLAILVNHFGWRQGLEYVAWITIALAAIFWLVLRDGQKSPTASLQGSPSRLRDAFKIPQVWWISLVGFCSWVTVTGVASLWGVPYLMATYGWTNTQTGYAYILFWLGLGLGSPFIGWLSDALKSRKIPFCLCFALGLISSLFYLKASWVPMWGMLILLFLLGFVASTQSLTFGIAKDIVPPQHFVAASGLINLAAVLTGVVTQPIMGYLIDRQVQTHAAHSASLQVGDYQSGFILISIVLLLGLIASYFGLKETRCQPQLS